MAHKYIEIGRDFRCRPISIPTKSKVAAGGHVEHIKMAISLLSSCPCNQCYVSV